MADLPLRPRARTGASRAAAAAGTAAGRAFRRWPAVRGLRPAGLAGRLAARDRAGLACAAALAAANACALGGLRVPFAEPALGLWFLLAYPAYLLYTSSAWASAPPPERAGYSAAAVVLALMLAGLALSTAAPLAGVSRPVGPVSAAVTGDVLIAALAAFRRRHPAPVAWRAALAATVPAETRLLAGAGLAVVLAVLGANRLNNSAGDQLSLAALVVVTGTFALALRGWRQLREGSAGLVVYGLALALLLMTSLRGWYVTGHDIQAEYRVFQLTAAHGRWDIASLRDPYNACLSITVLPALLAGVVHVDPPYIFKFCFQLLFALCPVMVYAIARRWWPVPVALLSAVCFVSFPTFFTDMPFMNRQEIAYLFVAAGILALTRSDWTLRRRRLTLVAAAAGAELAHYSTMYVFLITLAVSWAVQRAAGLARRGWLRPPGGSHRRAAPWAVIRPVAGAAAIAAAAVITLTWSGPVTRTGGSAVTDAAAAVNPLTGGLSAGAASYGLLSGAAPSPAAVLARYRAATWRLRAGYPPGAYPPAAVLARYRAPAITAPALLPLTAAGRALAAAGIGVTGLNTVIRLAAAKGEQLLLAAGLALACTRRFRRRVSFEFYCLCLGATAAVAAITVLPGLSADYGVLRAFQQALIVVAPVIAAGSLAALSFLRRRALAVAAAAWLGLAVSTTGLLPQLTGGYPAQLSLNDSGAYYDVYYTHPQEAAAIAWLAGQPGVLPDGVQAENLTSRFYFTSPRRVTGRQYIADIYPTLIRRSSWVILGYQTVRTGIATAYYDDELLPYAYPRGYLRQVKNLVYDNGGAQVYR